MKIYVNKFYVLILLMPFFISCNEKASELKKEEGFLDIEDSKIHYKMMPGMSKWKI